MRVASSSGMFRGGRNIAMKVPPHQFEATVAFYRDVLGLAMISPPSAGGSVGLAWAAGSAGAVVDGGVQSVGFDFGSNQLWIDRVATVSRSEVWLEVITADLAAADAAMKAAEIARFDAIEPLPDGFAAFWIAAPSGVVHLVAHERAAW